MIELLYFKGDDFISSVIVVGVNSKYSHSSLALRYFRENSGCDIYECSINDNIFDVYMHLCEMDYEIFCFSVYIWNVEFILKLVPMLKNARPEIKIIFGGPEAGYNYNELLTKYSFIDGIITGEGEYAIAEIVKGSTNEDIPNYVYRINDRIVCNEVEKVDLEKINFPYNEKDIEELKNKIIYFETSRGCCFNCSYCLSSSEGKTRYFNMDYVKKGIKFFIDNNVELVKFVDRTFNDNNERACEILNYIVDNNKNTKFHFEVSPLLLTEEFKTILSKAAGLVQLEMGIQTTNIATMKCINRVYDTEKVRAKLSSIPKDIHIHLDLIAGLPEETLETFIDGFNYAYSFKPDMLQLGFLKLLHHTVMKSEAEKYGIVTTDFPPYEVLSTDTMSAESLMLLKKVEMAVDKVYNSGSFEKTMELLTSNSSFEIFKTIGLEIYENEKTGPISKIGLYEVMFNIFGEDIKFALVLDFLKSNPKANLPEYLADDRDDLKDIHKELVKSEKYKNLKIKVVAACSKLLVVSANGIDII